VNNADDRKIALAYMKENQVTFPNILDTSEAANRAMTQYETLGGMSAVPMTYVIDRKAKWSRLGMVLIRTALKRPSKKLGL